METKINEPVKVSCTVIANAEVLLGTARVKIFDRHNQSHLCRVLLDGCSQSNFIIEKLARKLGLQQERIDLPFAGLGQI